MPYKGILYLTPPAQLRLETEALKTSLQKAQEEKMMKEGEASNMKRALEKV